MTDPHTKHAPHDHSKMGHDQNMNGKVDIHAGHAGTYMVEAAGEHAQHVDHSGHEDLFRRRFWVSLLLSIPVLLYTPMLQMWFGFRLPEFAGSLWTAPLFSIIVFLSRC